MSNVKYEFTPLDLLWEVLSVIPDQCISERSAERMYGDDFKELRRQGKVKMIHSGKAKNSRMNINMRELVKLILKKKYNIN